MGWAQHRRRSPCTIASTGHVLEEMSMCARSRMTFGLLALFELLVISVGYMDPGNWATDLAGGSSFGYMLLFVILLSNLMAVVLQGLAVKLGVVSGLGKLVFAHCQ